MQTAWVFIAICASIAAQTAPAQTVLWEFVPGLDTAMIVKSIVSHKQQIFVGRASSVNWLEPGYCGLFRSNDNGQSWSNDTAYCDADINGLCSYSDYLIASCDRIGHLPDQTRNGIFRTSDFGVSWEQVRMYQNPYYFGRAANYLFAGAPHNSVIRSSNGGKTWRGASAGATGVMAFCQVDSLVYGAKAISPGIGAIVRSADSGNTWYTPYAFKDPPLTFYHGNGVFLLGATNEGVYRSTDRGDTWHWYNTGMIGNTAVSVYTFHAARGILYAGTSVGLYHSTNYGARWQKTDDAGLNGKIIKILISHGDYLFAGTDSGLYRAKLLTTGVDETPVGAIHELPLQISPNPAGEYFTVDFQPGHSLGASGSVSVTVRDVFGRAVYAGAGGAVSTAGWAAGVYFVEAAAGASRAAAKVIVVGR